MKLMSAEMTNAFAGIKLDAPWMVIVHLTM